MFIWLLHPWIMPVGTTDLRVLQMYHWMPAPAHEHVLYFTIV